MFLFIESAELDQNGSKERVSFLDSQFAHGVGPLKEPRLGGVIEERFHFLGG